MNEYLVTIIVPVYNCDKYLKKCITSLINQSYRKLELIFVNDGSTDNSLNILMKYKDKIKIINQQNKGSSYARNTGIKNATGDYIMFVDGDDFIDNNMVESMLYAITKKNVDIARCNRKDFYINNNHISKIKPLYDEQTIITKKQFKNKIYNEFFKRGKLNSMCMTLFDAKIIKKNNLTFDQSLYVDEDVVFAMNLFDRANGMVYLPNDFYTYVRHGKGLSGKGINCYKRTSSRLKSIEYNKYFFKKWNFSDKKILVDSVSFVAVYTAFQLSRFNSNGSFADRYHCYNKIINENKKYIKQSSNSNLYIYESILRFLINHNMKHIGFIYGGFSNIIVNLVRKMI